MEKKGSVQTLVRIGEAFIGLKWCLTGGTCLGAVRDGTLIPWRSCLNVACFADGLEVKRRLLAAGFDVTVYTSDPIRFMVAQLPGAYVDVHVLEATADGYQFWLPRYMFKLPRRFFDCLETAYIDGVAFNVPAFTDEYLTELYGNWRRPWHGHNFKEPFLKYLYGPYVPKTPASVPGPRGAWHG